MVNVLIVEDDRSLAHVYEEALTREGYDVINVGSCGEAIDALNQHDVALVVLDMNLPDEPGTKVLDYIESEPVFMDVLTIVLTGFTRFVNQSSRPSVLHTMNKPVTGTMLARTVKTALASTM